MSENSEKTVDRRTYLTALSAAGAAGLAGCGGGGGNGGQDGGGQDGGQDGNGGQQLGERVGTVPIGNMTSVAGAANIEQANVQIARLLQQELGVPTKVESFELLTYFKKLNNDARDFNFSVDLFPPFMKFLDPANIMGPFHIQHAGVGGQNAVQYASCDYSRAIEKQATATSKKARQDAINDALSTMSEDMATLPLNTVISSSAYRTDQLNASHTGKSGANARNPEFLWYTEPTGDTEAIRSNMTPNNIASPVFFKSPPPTPWNITVYAPLFYYDAQFQRQPHLATDVSISNERKTFTFSLREDATFHDGEPVTAEDVKWTYEFFNAHPAEFPPVPKQDYESINVLDEHTVEVNFKSTNATFLNAFVPIWGILPKHVWTAANASQNPANPDLPEIIGCGPYQVTDFSSRSTLALTPYEDHWIDAKGDIIFRGYSDRQAGFRAFQSGSLNLLINITTETGNQIRNQMSNTAKVVSSKGFTHWTVRPQLSFAPSMFPEFRQAVSQILPRKRINQIMSGGRASLQKHYSFLSDTHPWFPDNPDEVLKKMKGDATPNPEMAKQTLKDAGYGWDDQGRLHYPPDKDLTPRWPQGKEPCDFPDQFPCLPELCPDNQ